MRLSRTGIKVLTSRYRHILLKCLALNMVVFAAALPAHAGQTITVDGMAIGADHVYGNGQKPYGSAAAFGNPNSNIVNFINGSSTNTPFGVVGGYFQESPLAPGIANGNTVNISGSITGFVSGGQANGSGNVSANNNTVNVTNSTIGSGASDWVLGDVAYSDTGSATANNNTVVIMGSSLNVSQIIGGDTISDSGTGTAINNTVTIGGISNLSAASIYGGFFESTGTAGDLWTGNTLNVMNSGMNVKGVYNFENLNFYAPTTMVAGDTMLTVNTSAVNITGSTIGIGMAGGKSALNVGDTITLVDATTGGLTADQNGTQVKGNGGISKLYDFDLSVASNKLQATIAGVSANPQTKALSEGQLGGMSFLNQGSDLIASSGMSSMLAATSSSVGNAIAFSAVGSGKSEYETGSHVDVQGVSLMAGIAKKSELTTAGIFLEAGQGNYDTYNSFNTAPSVKGSGDTEYVGLGVLGRYDVNNAYGEVSMRMGRTKTDFNSSDFVGGTHASYDTSAMYAGTHIGAGYVLNLDKSTSVDFSTKLFWTYQDQGDDSIMIAGDKVEFDSVNSLRSRTGARFSFALQPTFVPYAGAYIEHEFGGKANATINGAKIDAPTLNGTTGVGELGLAIKPAGTLPLTIDAGVQGYAGTRQGVSGSLNLKYEF